MDITFKVINNSLISFLLLLPLNSVTAAPICSEPGLIDGYVVGFFNGVGNTKKEAQAEWGGAVKVFYSWRTHIEF